jgi:putative ABC transport system permease protein
MNIWKISLQNLKSKPLYTFLSVLVLSLSIALLIGINQLKTSFEYQMENNLGNIDLVIGAKGSPLQLILASVLHIDNPTGNISYAEAKKIVKNPLVKSAVPISYGDNYKGYKIVGTTPAFLDFYEAELQDGNMFDTSFEAIIGHSIAERLQLKIGDSFQSSHGLIENEIDVHDHDFVVVGILKPTQKVIDRLILTNLKSIWDVHSHGDDHNKANAKEESHTEHNHDAQEQGQEDHAHHDHGDSEHDHSHEEHHHHENEDGVHDHEHHSHEDQHHHDNHEGAHDHDHAEKNQHDEHNHSTQEHTEEDKEITSMLISFRNPIALLNLPRKINKDTNLLAAIPKFELNRLYEFTGVGIQTISWIAYIILFISGMTIFISLYKMIKERAFDLALLRTYGASNFQLVKMVSYEGVIIVIFALLLGFLLSKATLFVLIEYVQSGPQYDILQSLPVLEYLKIIGLVFVMIVLSIAFAIYPIIRLNISKILRDEK